MNDLNSEELIVAVRLWVGWGGSPTPSRSDQRVIDHFGDQGAKHLLPVIKQLEDDYYSSKAHLIDGSLQEMEELASKDFIKLYPAVAPEIVKCFAWCHSFDFR